MIRARLKCFYESGGYGFLTPIDGGSDVFVHARVIGLDGSDTDYPEPGTLYDIEYSSCDRGLFATSARVVTGE
jgi:cold shock CspA family protein